jgi:phosphohistidine phosphatase SixA
MQFVVHRLCLTLALFVLTACQPAPAAPATTAPAPTAPATTKPAVAPAASPSAAVAASPAVAPAASPAAKPAASPSPSPAASGSPVACTFVLGFGAMRDLVGAQTVGACVENQKQVQGTDNATQKTANGALFFRAIDNRVLFANATQTWINGPSGLVTRPNTQRFEWEGDRQMIEGLQKGGYVVYFRHGATDNSQQDTDPNNLADCTNQRNLNDAGRAQGRAIGEAWTKLKIPVASVLSSQYCRALEYSRLAFNQATPEPNLNLPDPLTDEVKAQHTAVVQKLISTPPPAGQNSILVAHSPNIRLAANVDLAVEGSAAVFKVDAAGSQKLIARVLPDDWPALAQALSSN